jgi:hypothetical protein
VNVLPTLLALAHLIGLSLAVGAATVKLLLLLRCAREPSFVPSYLAMVRTVTRPIIVGLALLILSGAGWMLVGYPLTTLLIAKLVLVAAVLALGPVIDNVVEPRFRQLAPAVGAPPSPDFAAARGRYLALEATATSLFYVIVIMWAWR